MTRADPGRRAALFLLLGLAVLATGRALGNGFAFDDVPIIVENAQVHSVAPPWVYAQQSYWPPANLGEAYRPWTIWGFALQWALGNGSPFVFHLVNLLLTAGLTLLVFGLARQWLPLAGATVAAAFFAIHPVHVEATANVVGQGELWMTLFTTAAVLIYARARRDGELGGRHRLALAALYVLAAASKEQGIVLPGLLLAVEWLAIPARPGERKVAIAARTMLLLGVVGIGFLAGRFAVLGDMGGGPPAAGLEGLGIGGRLRVMLPMVPDLIRLLVWPRSLLSQYTPPAYGGPTTAAAAAAGAVLLAAVVAAAILARRRLPVATLGLVWIGVGLLPVSNIPFPTGILIAERTLFLPSVGAALAGGALFMLLAGRRPAWLAPAAAGLLIALGAARTFSRQAVWHDNTALFDQSLIDEPRSYRTYFVAGREYVIEQRPDAAIAAFRRAAELYGGDQRVFEEWGQVLRSQGRCADAIPILERGLALDPTRIVSRSRLVECLLTAGRAEDAANAAREGIALGGTEFQLPLDRALKALARPDPASTGPPAPPGRS